ncbi:MAG: septum site-determining protein MinC [Clostridia bacterium]|nr:septum site-determining protein MinC [Clostridia bacterium]
MLTIKGLGKKIKLCFTSDTTFADALSDIGKERKLFHGADCNISYSGIELSYDEEMLLEKSLKEISEKIVLEKKKCLSKQQIEYSFSSEERILRVVERNLRSGEVIESRGDLVVYGDVNPGALLRAEGNITVIGALRGAAHVTGSGKVYATYMSPSQIKIGKVCSYNKKGENVGSAVAMTENGEIILECL